MHVEETIDLKSNFFYHKVKILMQKYVEIFWDEWELDDAQYFVHCVEIDNTNIIFNLDLDLGQLGQAW